MSRDKNKMSSKMEYNFLGKSGLKVSNLCLGTMTFGESTYLTGQCDEKASFALLDKFIECGGNFIDTANVYSSGQSEQIVGNWLQKRGGRDDLVIATKVSAMMNSKDVNCRGLSRKHILWSVEESLKRLQTDYIDLYQFHGWDNGTPLEESLRTFDDLVRSGKVRYLGASNVTGWQLQKVVDCCSHMGLSKYVSLQQQYNLLCREVEWELVDVCRNEGLGYLPWSPLKGGWLSGKMQKGMIAPPVGSRVEMATSTGASLQSSPNFDKFNNEKTWNLLDTMASIGKEHGKSVAQVALRWLLQRDTVDSVIIGAKKMSQLEDNLGAAGGWLLTDEQMETLDAASAPDLPYPYEMVWRINKGRRGKLGP